MDYYDLAVPVRGHSDGFSGGVGGDALTAVDKTSPRPVGDLADEIRPDDRSADRAGGVANRLLELFAVFRPVILGGGPPVGDEDKVGLQNRHPQQEVVPECVGANQESDPPEPGLRGPDLRPGCIGRIHELGEDIDLPVFENDPALVVDENHRIVKAFPGLLREARGEEDPMEGGQPAEAFGILPGDGIGPAVGVGIDPSQDRRFREAGDIGPGALRLGDGVLDPGEIAGTVAVQAEDLADCNPDGTIFSPGRRGTDVLGPIPGPAGEKGGQEKEGNDRREGFHRVPGVHGNKVWQASPSCQWNLACC